MNRYIDKVRRPLRTIVTILVAFAIARLALGVFAIIFLSDDGLATSLRATLIFGAAAIVAVIVALFVRRTPNDQRRTTNP